MGADPRSRASSAAIATLLAVLAVTAGLPAGTGSTADAHPGTDEAGEGDVLDHVDPLIGTVAPGFVNPGPVRPHGMVGLGPDTEGPFNYGGYFVHNAVVTGFSHTHMSAGVPQAGHVPILPVVGDVSTEDVAPPGWTNPVPAYASPFEHGTEVAEPGYYAVTLERYGTRAELSATDRAGIHRYTFPPESPAKIVLDLSRNLRGWDPASLTLEEDGTLVGSVTSDVRGEFTVHTAIRLDHPFQVRLFDGSVLSPGETASGDRLGAFLELGPVDEPVHVKVGLSYTDAEGAVGNLDAEIPGFGFDRVREDAREDWREALSKIEVSGGTPDDETRFYTALYHAQLFPNLYSDVDGRYAWIDGVVRQSEVPRYTQFSLWDSYNGQNQLLAFTDPAAYTNMTRSLVNFARATGSLPQWQLFGHDAAYMSGDPVIPFVAEAHCRGLLADLDPGQRARLYAEMLELADDRPAAYENLGYLPTKRPSSPADLLEGGPSEAGTTLEYALADLALALVADRTDRGTDRDRFAEAAESYGNLVDPDTGFVRPRHADGAWLDPFRPELNYGFQEGTSWQYSWLAPQDVAGLIEAMGGPDVVRERLDTLFSFPAQATVPVVPGKAQTHATAFGTTYYGNQYVPGNEHDLQAPFLYNYAGAPWQTQAAARGAASTFTATPDGLPGNDDLGALSGWLVWTMLGLYPVTPGAPGYTVASPVFEEATIHTPRGDVTIQAPGASTTNKYVQQARLGGQPLEGPWILEEDLLEAGQVTLEMGPLPDRSWGTQPDQAPPSLSTHPIEAFGC